MINGMKRELTAVNDTMDIVEVCQAFQYSQRHMADHINIDGTYLLVDPVQRALVHELHADANIGIGKKRAIE